MFRDEALMTTVNDTGDGFSVTDRTGTRQFKDDQVVGLNLFSKPKYAKGLLKSTRRCFHIWVDGEPTPIKCEDKIMAGDSDPLMGLIERISENFRELASMALEAGAVIEGEGFALTNTSLLIGPSAHQMETPLNEIASYGIFDDQFRVWGRGQNEAVLSLPLSAKNCYALELLLSERVQTNSVEPKPSEGLGRILFERKPTASNILVMWGLAIAAFIGAVVFAADGWVLPLCCVLGGVGFIIGGINALRSRFRCHESGVYRQTLFSQRQILYEDLQSFSYQAVRHFTNGVYTSTKLDLTFKPKVTVNEKPITFSTDTKTGDNDLDGLRDHISRVIAGEMAERLRRDEEVVWTNNLTFAPEGLRYRPSGFLGKKEFQYLPYAEFHGFDIQEGFLHLWKVGQDKSVIAEPISADNFFPGFLLLVTMFEGEDEAAE